MKITINNNKYKIDDFNKQKKEFYCKNKIFKINEIDTIELSKDEFEKIIKETKATTKNL